MNVDYGAVSPRCERIAKADIPAQCAQGFRRILEPRCYLLLRIARTAWRRHQQRDHDKDEWQNDNVHLRLKRTHDPPPSLHALKSRPAASAHGKPNEPHRFRSRATMARAPIGRHGAMNVGREGTLQHADLIKLGNRSSQIFFWG